MGGKSWTPKGTERSLNGKFLILSNNYQSSTQLSFFCGYLPTQCPQFCRALKLPLCSGFTVWVPPEDVLVAQPLPHLLISLLNQIPRLFWGFWFWVFCCFNCGGGTVYGDKGILCWSRFSSSTMWVQD